MVRTGWLVLALVLAAFCTAQLRAADAPAGGGRGRGTVPIAMDMMVERLGADNALSEDQKKKVEVVNAEWTKKMEEANKKEGVAAAREAMKNAQDQEARTAARKKLTEAYGFDAREEYKKALAAAGLNEAQLAKLFPQRRPAN